MIPPMSGSQLQLPAIRRTWPRWPRWPWWPRSWSAWHRGCRCWFGKHLGKCLGNQGSNGKIISGDAYRRKVGWKIWICWRCVKNLGGAEVVSVKICQNTLTDCEQKAKFSWISWMFLPETNPLPADIQKRSVYCLVGYMFQVAISHLGAWCLIGIAAVFSQDVQQILLNVLNQTTNLEPSDVSVDQLHHAMFCTCHDHPIIIASSP